MSILNVVILEVRGEDGNVMLQVELLKDRVRVQGQWRDSNGGFFMMAKNDDSRNPGGLFITDPNTKVRIKPMFRYPSELHLGELAAQ